MTCADRISAAQGLPRHPSDADEYRGRRLDVATKYAQAAAATSQLAVTEEDCRDIMFATMDGALWHRLVVERGWSYERFAQRLAALWVSLLAQPAASQGSNPPTRTPASRME